MIELSSFHPDPITQLYLFIVVVAVVLSVVFRGLLQYKLHSSESEPP